MLSSQINRWLPNYAVSYANALAQQFQTQISFQTVHYRFPDRFIFKNVKVLGTDGHATLLQASQVTVGLFNNMTVDGIAVNWPVLKIYWIQHGQKIYTWTKLLPKGPLHLMVSNGRFKIDLNLNRERFNAHGFWDGQSSLNLWGSWQGNDVDWEGFILGSKFYVLDIDGRLHIEEKNIVLQRLSFAVNGEGVGILGKCSRQNLFQCDAQLASQNIGVHLYVQNTPQGLLFKGTVDVDGTHVDFKNLEALLINGNVLKLKIEHVQSTSLIQGHPYSLPLEQIFSVIDLADPYQKIITLSAKLFAGHGYSRIFLDTSGTFPWPIKSQGSFEGLEMPQGLLSGNFKLQSAKELELSGSLALHHGHFDNTQFQRWVAKTLQMPSLTNVSDADLSCRFNIDGQSKAVDDLRLETGDLNLGGFFHLDADHLVSSRGAVRFSKKLLSESSIGRKIIGLVRGAWTLPFEFRLSGNIDRMNFQWDNSPLKDKVRQHMLSFFERMIDRRMDAHPYYKMTLPNESLPPG